MCLKSLGVIFFSLRKTHTDDGEGSGRWPPAETPLPRKDMNPKSVVREEVTVFPPRRALAARGGGSHGYGRSGEEDVEGWPMERRELGNDS